MDPATHFHAGAVRCMRDDDQQQEESDSVSKILRTAFSTMAGVAVAVALTGPAAATGIEPNPGGSTPTLTVPGPPAPGVGPSAGTDYKPGPTQDNKPKTGGKNNPGYCDHAHNQVCQPGHRDTPDCDLGHARDCGGKPGGGKPGGGPGHPGGGIPAPTPDTTSPTTTPTDTPTPAGEAAPAGNNAAPAGNTTGKTPAASTLPKTGPGNPVLLVSSGLLMIIAGLAATAWVLRRKITFKA